MLDNLGDMIMSRPKTKTVVVERPCWYKVVEIGPDDFDLEVWKRLYGVEDDEELAPVTENIESLAAYIEQKYANESTNKHPITKHPHLLRTSWCADDWRLLMSYDVNQKKFIMWRKATYESVEKVPIEDEVKVNESV